MEEQTNWKSAKAPRALSALQRIGWVVKRQTGSHRTMSKAGWPDFVFAYHDRVEIGPVALKKLAQRTGLKPEDL